MILIVDGTGFLFLQSPVHGAVCRPLFRLKRDFFLFIFCVTGILDVVCEVSDTTTAGEKW